MATVSYTYLMDVYYACRPPAPTSVSILRCWWLFSRVNRAVVFCWCSERQHGPAALCSLWPCSNTPFLLPVEPLFCSSPFAFFSEGPVARSSLNRPLRLLYPTCSEQYSLESLSFWPLTDWDGSVWPWRIGCFCILLEVSVSFYVSASSRCLYLSPLHPPCV